MFAYEKLGVWQMAKSLIIKVYKLTRYFPDSEKFGLVSQINRAAVSVASNLAEGSGRMSYKEQAYFTQLAYSSLMEVACQLDIARELGFIEEHHWKSVAPDIEDLSYKLSALRNSQLKRKPHP